MRIRQCTLAAFFLFQATIALAQTPQLGERPLRRSGRSYAQAQLGMLPGDGAAYVVGITFGKALTNHLSTGIGVEFDKYEWGALIPVFGMLRLNANRAPTTGTFTLGVGYSAAQTQQRYERSGAWSGGTNVTILTGIEAFFSKHTAFHVEIGPRFQWHGAGRGWSTSKTVTTSGLITFGLSHYVPSRRDY